LQDCPGAASCLLFAVAFLAWNILAENFYADITDTADMCQKWPQPVKGATISERDIIWILGGTAIINQS
jgi:hypothetical protein